MERDDDPRTTDRLAWRHSLSIRLFWLTIAVVLFVEALVFIPSAGMFRTTWLEERAQAARVATLALEATPSRDLSRELSSALLQEAEVLAVAETDDGMRFQILAPQTPITGDIVASDLRELGIWNGIWQTIGTVSAQPDRTLMIVDVGAYPDRVIEVLVPENALRADLVAFGWRILWLSLIISVSAGVIVYLLLFFLVVRPMRRVTRSVEQFRDDPGSWTRRLPETSRRDEIGRAQNALADMESAVSDSFRQRERLAQLGEAVARINHDLRGSLAAAQLVSDGLSRSEDPRVQRAAPRLERALERAITLATQTLDYGKARAPAVQLQDCRLFDIVEEAAHEAINGRDGVDWLNAVPPDRIAHIDADNLHRIVANLVRNGAEAMPGGGRIEVRLDDHSLLVCDDGPGLPDEVRDELFKPFGTARKRGGTGLGLAIARDLARAMGGDLDVRETSERGTVFSVRLPHVAPA